MLEFFEKSPLCGNGQIYGAELCIVNIKFWGNTIHKASFHFRYELFPTFVYEQDRAFMTKITSYACMSTPKNQT